MMKVKSIYELNQEVLEWWNKLPEEYRKDCPTFIHDLKKAKILFVGLNPAGDKGETLIDDITDEEIKSEIDKEKKHIFGTGQIREGQYKTYFGRLSDIADELGVKFEHYDLFHMRCKDSKKLVKEIFEKNSILKKIYEEHLTIFDQVLRIVNPKVVITNNINTANILMNRFNLKFSDENGLYKKDGDNKFYYLSGIMSYGRQTKYDMKRLTWIVKKAL